MHLKGGRKGMDCSLVVGDMGMGFIEKQEDNIDGIAYLLDVPTQHKFIRGNHDDANLCYKHPNYLGDFGYHEHSGIFYVSGGFSIDWKWREKYLNWWPNEELSPRQRNNCFELYKKAKPSIVVAHECPIEVKSSVITNLKKYEQDSRTEELLQKMVDAHRPDYFIFGHHHKRINVNMDGTEYVCLDTVSYHKYADCIFEIPGVTWE